MFLAIRLGAVLVAVLFTHLGEPIMREIMSGGATEGLSGIQAVLVGVFVLIGAFVVALLVVVTLVSPIFLLLPVATTALALFTSRAGLILRTLWLMLMVIAVLAVVVNTVTFLLDVRADRPVWAGVLVVGGFLGRMIVEFWKPDQAGVRTSAGVAVDRWTRLGLVWLALVLVTAILGALLFGWLRPTQVSVRIAAVAVIDGSGVGANARA